MKVQRDVPLHDADQLADRAIRFRVGITIGDSDAGRATWPLGRMSAGGVSRSVRDHVHGRLGLEFDERGTKDLAWPIEAFVLRLGAATVIAVPVSRASGTIHLTGQQQGR